VMADAVLTSKCCFDSFCDKCKRLSCIPSVYVEFLLCLEQCIVQTFEMCLCSNFVLVKNTSLHYRFLCRVYASSWISNNNCCFSPQVSEITSLHNRSAFVEWKCLQMTSFPITHWGARSAIC
jgi:hypothetical protein